VAIDKLFDHDQNKRKATRFEDVNFIIEKDIKYADADACLLDTYRVENGGEKYPVMLYIHGGGFVAGDKHYRRAHSRWIAQQGYFVVNINYGLCPEYKFPEPLRHLVYALNWIGDNAEKYNLDLDKLVVSGDSAGGYYSTVLACIATDKDLQARLGVSTDLRFSGAVLNCGIYDVAEALSAKIPFDLGGKILYDVASISKKEFDTFEFRDICSPIEKVTSEFPKAFIVYAVQDFFCRGQGERLLKNLADQGVYTEEYHSTKFMSNHCFSLNWRGKDPEKANSMTEDFLARFKRGEI
jgi:acetyl esterase/lipase